MRTTAKVISIISFLAVSLPCCFYFQGSMSLEMVQSLAGLGTVGWFFATPIWMGRDFE